MFQLSAIWQDGNNKHKKRKKVKKGQKKNKCKKIRKKGKKNKRKPTLNKKRNKTKRAKMSNATWSVMEVAFAKKWNPEKLIKI